MTPGTRSSRRAAYRDVLAIPSARVLIAASASSQLGDWLYNAALLGYVYQATRSAAWVAAATIFRLVPYVLLGPLGGALADRYRRRTVLLAGDGLRLLLMLALAGVVAAHGPIAVVIAMTALASAAGSAEKPAVMALLPRLVGESRLGAANALVHIAQDLGIVVGPALGALLLALAPAWAAFLANGATFALSAVLISTMRPDARPPAAGHSGMGQLAAGLRALRATPFAVWLMVAVAMVEFTYGAQTVQLVVYAERLLGLGRGGYGLLLAATGVGGVLSAFAAGRLTVSRRISLVVIVTGSVGCATQLAYAGVDSAPLAVAVTVLGGIGLVLCEVVGETALARIVPREALGRIMGIFDAASVGAMIAGALIAPGLIAWTSLRASLVILGLAALFTTLLCWIGLRGLDALSAQRSEAIAARVALLERLPVTLGVRQLVLEQLAASAQLCELPPGVNVVVEGAPAHAFYAVAEGHVVVHRGGEVVVHLGPGDSFGERGLLDAAPRNATVTATTELKLLRIEGRALLEALEAWPALRSALEVSSTTPGVEPPPEATAFTDDRGRVKA